jgi:RecA-family ATPase
MHGKDGLATFDKFKDLLPPLDTIPKVASSRGGFHLYFRKPADALVTRSQLQKRYGEGVDIIVNQQVVIPASIHPTTGRPYEFTNMPDDIPFWTPELEQLLTRNSSNKSNKSTVHDEEETIDPDLVAHLLTAIPNTDDTDYDEWFAIGCAIHRSTHGSEEGRQLFHDWSMMNALYDVDYTDAKWESIGNYQGEMRGFGSLVLQAKEHNPQLTSNVLDKLNHVSPEDDFKDLPPPDKNFDKTKFDWHLVEEPLSYDDIEPDEWFYKDVLPKGAYAVMAGRQGLGKSTLIMQFAAAITRGDTFMGDHDNPVKREPGDVIYFSVEERIRQSILPKLKLAKADLSRFHVYRAGLVRERKGGKQELKGFSVTDGLRQLEDVCIKYPHTKLVIFDPITMFILHNQDSDSHNTTSMNQALAPLNRLAEKYDLCVLGITHFNKSGGRGLDKVTGSIAHTTVARHVTYLLPHYVEHHTILATAKSNMFTDKTSYVFEGVEIDPEYVPGFSTPLRQRDIHLYERCDEGRDADAWERIVETHLEDSNRQSAVDHLTSSITEHITLNSMQKAYWTTRNFKTYFREQFNNHERTFDEAMQTMLNSGQLHQENVGGQWYIWFVDGLIAPDSMEVEAFHEEMRETIRSDTKRGNTDEIMQQIQEYVNNEFPREIPYSELHDEFLDYTERQIQNAIRAAVEQKLIERIHKSRVYYVTGV